MLNAAAEEQDTLHKIASEKEAEDVLGRVQDILDEVCGDFIDDSLEGAYESFIGTLLDLFDERFPCRSGKPDELMRRLFTLEDPTCFKVSYRCLMRRLDDYTVALLQPLLRTNAFFAYTYKMSLMPENRQTIAVACLQDEWQRYVTLLVSTPNRVANALKGNLPDFFRVDRFANYIFATILQLIECFSEGVFEKRIGSDSIRYECISTLLSKVLLNLYQEDSFDGAECLVNILALITNYATDKTNEYKLVIQGMVSRLERPAIEIFAKIVLSHLDPKKFKAEPLFGAVILREAQWKYVLCRKIPMLTYHGCHHDNLIVNLCAYLSAVSAEAHAKLLFDLSHVWTDRFAMNHSSVEERVYFAKLMVCLLRTSPTPPKGDYMSENDRNIFQRNIRDSVPMHLESTVVENRVLGMKIAELFLNHFNSGAKEKLKFSYEGVGGESLKILQELECMADKKFGTDLETVKDVQEEVAELFEKLQCPDDAKKVPERVSHMAKNKHIVEEAADTAAEPNERSNVRILDPTDFELDSDDDLEPYDTSDDPKEGEAAPRYLRDLKEALLETQSAEKLQAALQRCESLVASQLPDDDVQLGLELLEILLSLEPRFHVEDLDALVLRSCVAVVCVYPGRYAEYLCKQIHAPLGTYSTSKRIFMLDVLVASAESLSDGPAAAVPMPVVEKAEGAAAVPKGPRDVVKERLQTKTRYFSKHRSTRRHNENRFAQVAAHYFFPLLYGFQYNKMLIDPSDDYTLLVRYVHALADVALLSKSALAVRRIGGEALRFCCVLSRRCHAGAEAKVKAEILRLVAVCLEVVQPEAAVLLLGEYQRELFELRSG
ncbi:unnamed protein product [Callosobruchus maculatus]|uniref:Telomere length regulation protein conserved domain-containing protein n=1 Tax=Callosobruchus maculatus TaxID=64391 RepID=A0A653BDH6_CALMS|nr:unnamed protein product [Callosobruchus maculatus]